MLVVAGLLCLPILPGGLSATTTKPVPRTAAPRAVTVPGNLLSGDRASFGTSTGGWVGSNAALSWVASAGDALPGALAMTATGSQGMGAAFGSPTSRGLVPAAAGLVYAAGVAADAVGGSQPVEPNLVFYDSAGNVLDTTYGPETQAAAGTWTQAAPVSALAPANTQAVGIWVRARVTTAGDVVYLDDAWIHGSPDAVPSVDGPLHTQGNQILQANGMPVRFRGIVRGANQNSAVDFPSDAEIAQAKAWGANFVRVPLNESYWLSTCPQSPTNVASYPSSVDSEVSSITSRGMVALLDLHWNVVQSCGTTSQHTMADAQYAPTFWSQLASRYQGNSRVAFDLYNEPHDISDAVWLNGGTASDSNVTYQAAGMQQLYGVVRGTGAGNLVFTSGQQWANYPASALVNGTDIVNAVHDYTCPSVPAPPAGNCQTPNPFDPYPILSKWLQVGQSRPVMITETGYPDRDDGMYFFSNLISDAEQLGWGWAAFAWDGTTYGDFDLLQSIGAAYQPSPAGMPVLCGLASAGSGTSPCAASAAPAAARVWGPDAEGTAVSQFEQAYPVSNSCRAAGSDTPVSSVIVAQAGYFSDALSAGYLAGQLHTGILLTPSGSLSPETAAAIAAEGVRTVYVVGGPLAISPSVLAQLAATPATSCGGGPALGTVSTVRIFGQTADDTAGQIATSCLAAAQLPVSCAPPVGSADLGALYGSNPYNDAGGTSSAPPSASGPQPTAIVASDAGFQDADAAGVVAAAAHDPLLVTAPTALSPQVPAALAALSVKQVLLVGGPLAVGDAVVGTLEGLGISVLRVGGHDYTDTAQLLARLELSPVPHAGLGWDDGGSLCVARGDFFADSLGAGPFCASAPGGGATDTGGTRVPLLLTADPSTVGPYLQTFLAQQGAAGAVGNLWVFGGPLALAEQTVGSLQAAVGPS